MSIDNMKLGQTVRWIWNWKTQNEKHKLYMNFTRIIYSKLRLKLSFLLNCINSITCKNCFFFLNRKHLCGMQKMVMRYQLVLFQTLIVEHKKQETKNNELCQTINKKERWLEHLVIEEKFIILQDDINKSQFKQWSRNFHRIGEKNNKIIKESQL